MEYKVVRLVRNFADRSDQTSVQDKLQTSLNEHLALGYRLVTFQFERTDTGLSNPYEAVIVVYSKGV